MTEARPEDGSTVRRILLGVQLRRLREASGVSRRTAGYTIRASESKMSRLELGRVGFKERDVVDLLTLYGVTEEAEREALLTLAREVNTPGWWHTYHDALPSWFQVYVGLEGAASLIRMYEVQFISGLPQTEVRRVRWLRVGTQAMADQVFLDLPGRVAKVLVDLVARFGTTAPSGGIRVAHDLTQEELAQLVGASRETVNKLVAAFANRGWIPLARAQ